MSDEIQILRHARARRMKLSVDPATGAVRLTLPPRAALKPALRWAEENRHWIERRQARVAPSVPFLPDTEIPFRGHDIVIRLDSQKLRGVRLVEGELLCAGPPDRISRRIDRWLRKQALDYLSADSAEYASRAGVSIRAVHVGDPRRRWGSCSSDGVLRYSWRLILAPDWVRRATAAHEVAHRLHMNHSPAFHAAVADILGDDPKPAHDWLRRHGAGLHRIGID